MKNKAILVSAALLMLVMNIGGADSSATVKTAANNDYPTLTRVEYVVGCMNRYGGENYTTMYGCVCAIDKIAATIPYDNYVATSTLAVMVKTPGERGNIFRDANNAREAIKSFREFLATTEKECGLKDVKKSG